MDVLSGDISHDTVRGGSLGQISPDPASVGQGDIVVLRKFEAALLLDGPKHGVRHQVSEVRLLGTAHLAPSVQEHLRSGEHLGILLI